MVPVKNLEGGVSLTIPEWNKILIDLFTSGYLQYQEKKMKLELWVTSLSDTPACNTMMFKLWNTGILASYLWKKNGYGGVSLSEVTHNSSFIFFSWKQLDQIVPNVAVMLYWNQTYGIRLSLYFVMECTTRSSTKRDCLKPIYGFISIHEDYNISYLLYKKI
jgi:hypothetical protein